MKDDLTQATVDSLNDLLDTERAALLEGNLEDVSRLHLRKEGLINSLNVPDFSGGYEVGALQEKLRRNQLLLDAALDGVRSVTRRLASIRQVRQSLDTYDSLGKKCTVTVADGGTLEKRA
ncbi:flagellar biosynthesis protein FlgN [uncultured Tateyamaria sp.]|uniref:flagellar biosynthesis protein FlgN n=1 Tax=uncultured Tateyamaria sp. TaxID=455651 RepID=UPI0026313B6E|nr:flagellar biosynthesis protein FlgN [uncultured Tateyamaria sp.]